MLSWLFSSLNTKRDDEEIDNNSTKASPQEQGPQPVSLFPKLLIAECDTFIANRL